MVNIGGYEGYTPKKYISLGLRVHTLNRKDPPLPLTQSAVGATNA